MSCELSLQDVPLLLGVCGIICVLFIILQAYLVLKIKIFSGRFVTNKEWVCFPAGASSKIIGSKTDKGIRLKGVAAFAQVLAILSGRELFLMKIGLRIRRLAFQW
jgi:hypothetical protein